MNTEKKKGRVDHSLSMNLSNPHPKQTVRGQSIEIKSLEEEKGRDKHTLAQREKGYGRIG